MFDVLSRQKAEKIAKQNGFKYFTLGNGQGLVGSLAAIGCLLEADHTYEAIAYRKEEHYGTARIVDKSKVIEYNKDTFPKTFNNYDYNHKRVMNNSSWTRSCLLRYKRRKSRSGSIIVTKTSNS